MRIAFACLLSVLALSCLSLILPEAVAAQGRAFAVLGKSSDDPNFIDVAFACELEALAHDDRCELLHAPGHATPRPQVFALRKALASGSFSAVAISVILSDPLAAILRNYPSLPVVTFDSPFDQANQDLSLAYVGPDNQSFGRDLAKIAMQRRPEGGRVVIMSAANDPNLRERVIGIRKELSGDDTLSGMKRLTGENGWIEDRRSPWLTGDNVERTLDQLTFSLKELNADVIISVGHWPVIQPSFFKVQTEPYHDQLMTGKTLVIAGVGNVSRGIQELLDDGLVAGVVSIDFPQIGKQLYYVLSDLLDHKVVPRKTLIPNKLIMGKN